MAAWASMSRLAPLLRTMPGRACGSMIRCLIFASYMAMRCVPCELIPLWSASMSVPARYKASVELKPCLRKMEDSVTRRDGTLTWKIRGMRNLLGWDMRRAGVTVR